MFRLTILTDYKPLNSYLELEAVKVSSHIFDFSSPEKASEVLSEYILFYLVEQKIDEFVRCQYIKSAERKDLSIFYSPYHLNKYEKEIAKELLFHIKKQNKFHLFGFIRFGIQTVQKELYNILYASLYDFYDHKKTPSDINWIKEFFHHQTTKHHLLSMEILESGEAVVYSKNSILCKDSYSKQYAVVGYLLEEKPQLLKVYDPHQLLQKELVIVLRTLFRAKVEFLNEHYSKNLHL